MIIAGSDEETGINRLLISTVRSAETFAVCLVSGMGQRDLLTPGWVEERSLTWEGEMEAMSYFLFS